MSTEDRTILPIYSPAASLHKARPKDLLKANFDILEDLVNEKTRPDSSPTIRVGLWIRNAGKVSLILFKRIGVE